MISNTHITGLENGVVISQAKISKPRQIGFIPRQRLCNQLDQSLQYPVIWISGPAGSGKTALVSNYLDKRNSGYIWYHIDHGDSDIATFFHYMSLAVHQSCPNRKEIDLPSFSQEYLFDIPAFTTRYFEAVYLALNQPFCIVLDNYNDVQSSALIHDVLRIGFSVIPKKITMIIISRTDPVPALTRMLAHNQMAVLSWKDLRLSNNETEAIILSLAEQRYPKETIAGIHKKTDGWIAGLLLLMKRTQIEEIEPQYLCKHTPGDIFNYFASELFDHLDQGIVSFLLYTSFFPKMTSTMAEQLTRNPDTDQILSDLTHGHTFVEKRMGDDAVYQYHPLFSEFLQKTAGQAFSDETRQTIRTNAAMILASHGHIEDAVNAYLAIGDIDHGVPLVVRHAQFMIAEGRHQTIENWLRDLPERVFNDHPWALYWLAGTRMFVNPVESGNLFQQVLPLFERDQDLNGIFLSFCGIFDSILYSLGSFKEYDRWFPKLDRLLSDHPVFSADGATSFQNLPVASQLIVCVLHAILFRNPEHPNLDTWEKRAGIMIESPLDINHKMNLILSVITNKLFTGNMAEANMYVTNCKNLIRTSRPKPLFLLSLNALETFYHWSVAQFNRCEQVASEGIELAEYSGVHLMTFSLLGHGCAGALCSGDLSLAESYLARMEVYLNFVGIWQKSFFDVLKCWQALLVNDVHHAHRIVVICIEHVNESGMLNTMPCALLAKAIILHKAGEPKDADKQLGEALRLSIRYKTHQVEFGCYLARAEFALNRHDDIPAARAIKNAMALGSKLGLYSTYFMRKEPLTAICSKALEAGIEEAYVHTLIRRYGLIPAHPHLTAENWPWPVKIYTLGRLGIRVNGKPLPFSGRGRQKPMDLLKALIVYRGNDVNVTTLQDLLWPDADGDEAANTFSTTLHRLRKILGNHQSIQVSQGKIRINETLCWVDAWFHEHLMDEACKLWEPNTTQYLNRAVSLTEKILNLQSLRFLPGDMEPWLIPHREYLNNKLILIMTTYGRHLENQGRLEHAITVYEKGLFIEPCHENFYYRSMQCHHKAGFHSKALLMYQRCHDILEKELGIKPGPDMKKLYHLLRNS